MDAGLVFFIFYGLIVVFCIIPLIVFKARVHWFRTPSSEITKIVDAFNPDLKSRETKSPRNGSASVISVNSLNSLNYSEPSSVQSSKRRVDVDHFYRGGDGKDRATDQLDVLSPSFSSNSQSGVSQFGVSKQTTIATVYSEHMTTGKSTVSKQNTILPSARSGSPRIVLGDVSPGIGKLSPSSPVVLSLASSGDKPVDVAGNTPDISPIDEGVNRQVSTKSARVSSNAAPNVSGNTKLLPNANSSVNTSLSVNTMVGASTLTTGKSKHKDMEASMPSNAVSFLGENHVLSSMMLSALGLRKSVMLSTMGPSAVKEDVPEANHPKDSDPTADTAETNRAKPDTGKPFSGPSPGDNNATKKVDNPSHDGDNTETKKSANGKNIEDPNEHRANGKEANDAYDAIVSSSLLGHKRSPNDRSNESNKASNKVLETNTTLEHQGTFEMPQKSEQGDEKGRHHDEDRRRRDGNHGRYDDTARTASKDTAVMSLVEISPMDSQQMDKTSPVSDRSITKFDEFMLSLDRQSVPESLIKKNRSQRSSIAMSAMDSTGVNSSELAGRTMDETTSILSGDPKGTSPKSSQKGSKPNSRFPSAQSSLALQATLKRKSQEYLQDHSPFAKSSDDHGHRSTEGEGHRSNDGSLMGTFQ